MKKTISLLLALALLAMCLPAGLSAQETAPEAAPVAETAPASAGVTTTTGTFILTADPSVQGAVSSTPKLNAGETFTGAVVFQNVGGESVTVTSIELKTSTNLSVFPFEVSQLNYYQPDGGAALGFSGPVSVGGRCGYALPKLRCRGDAAQGYYDMPFEIKYTTASGAACVETVVLPVLIVEQSAGVAGETPKVIVTAFSTSPAQVVAGEEFTLSVTFQNKSGTTAANNIKAALTSDGTFNPVSGSSTLYIDGLAPGGSAAVSIRLKAKADVAPGSYNIVFNLNYDAPGQRDGAPITDTEVVAVPVKQVPKVQVSALQLSSTEVFVGQDLNVMASVNNTGKSVLYNVNAVLSDDGGTFAAAEQYLGNIQPGGTGAVDVYMSAAAAGMATVKLTLTYEDENGEKYTYSAQTEASAMERVVMDDPFYEDMPVEAEKSGVPGWLIGLMTLLAVGGVVALVLVRKEKKAREAKERDRADAQRMNEEFARMDAQSAAADEAFRRAMQDSEK